MIDLHCHILPGIDDGAEDINASIAMAEKRLAKELRISFVPHITTMENTAIRSQRSFLSLLLTRRIRRTEPALVSS